MSTLKAFAVKALRPLTLVTAVSTLMGLSSVYAQTVAVIDSGLDIEHKDIKNRIYVNAKEVAGNGKDDDKNGYVDDVNGWNFVGNSNVLLDKKLIGSYSKDVYKYFEVQLKGMRGEATQEEKDWMKQMRKDESFKKELNSFGNFMHGTHVSGIVTKNSTNSKILGVKLIAGGGGAPRAIPPQEELLDKPDAFKKMFMKKALSYLATKQAEAMKKIFSYVDGQKARVANGSFGSNKTSANRVVGPLFKAVFGKEGTPEVLGEFSGHFINEVIANGKTMVDAAPNTLFVFAAGNDGADNEVDPHSPCNIRAENVMSVAATFGTEKLASFSNYSKKLVDVAAPGVGIRSLSPGNEYIAVSGTSQAAPFVAAVAADVIAANKSLKPGEVKKIIMQTVDKKSFLASKVLSGGIVNRERAVTAAKNSLKENLDKAIDLAMDEVGDNVNKELESLDMMGEEGLGFPLFVSPLQDPLKVLDTSNIFEVVR